MSQFEFDFNSQDRNLILSQDISVLSRADYVRIIVYPAESPDNIVNLSDNTVGIDGKAIFFSSLSETSFFIDTSPFGGTQRLVGAIDENGDSVLNNFKLFITLDNQESTYYDDNQIKNFYIKPNEIFNTFGLPQGSYKIQIDFLNQLSPPPYVNPSADTDDLEDDSGGDIQIQQQAYDFVVRQISTSRKEIRIKILNKFLENNSADIFNIINELNNFEPETIIDDDENSITFEQEIPNPNYKYQFKHVLNIGDGNHIPITNYTFDRVTGGRDNQSIILKLYKPVPSSLSNLDRVTIEREVLTTQVQDIYYFSDVPDVFFGDGLESDPQENWINPDGNDIEFQSYNELSESISDTILDTYISQSIYDYPNLNTDFNVFENHTFFGSAKKKLENFRVKVETIQTYYSEISKSLNISSSITGDSDYIIGLRKNYFNLINGEINSFTPYERFLYYDGQSETTASAPGLGKNYSEKNLDGIQINSSDGFDVIYKHTSEAGNGVHDGVQNLFSEKYFVHDKPFFNYSSSIYLSFLAIANTGSSITWNNTNDNPTLNGIGVPLPAKSKNQNEILNPNFTSESYQRYIFETSHSYFAPVRNFVIDDINGVDLYTIQGDMGLVTDFTQDSTQTINVTPKLKIAADALGTYFVRDSSGFYASLSTHNSESVGLPFSGSFMPAGELFHIFNENTLSSSLQGYWNIDDVTSGSSLSLANVVNDAGPTTGDAVTINSVTASSGVEVHGRQYGSSYFMISESHSNTGVHFDTTDFNFNKDDNFSLSIWAKRFHPTATNADPTTGTIQGIFTRGTTDDSFGIDYNHNDNQIRVGVRPGNSDTRRGAVKTMSDDLLDWHHIVMTYESSSATGLKLYVDGVLEDSNTTVTDLDGNVMGDFSSSITNDVERLTIGGSDVTAGSAKSYNGFLQYPRVYDRAITAEEVNSLYLNPTGITETKITDVKVTLKDPTNVLPFDNLFHTSSTEWTNWYNDALTRAETFDTDNIHSLENNLPLYIQESSDYQDMKDFLNLQGEQYDLIRNHIDSMGTLHKRGYNKTNSPPENILPMLLSNMGWEAINPFTGSLEDTLSQYLTGVTSIDDIKNNTWRKTLNNLLYIYKSKGTQNSVRGLLNVYGYPPDVLRLQEYGGVTNKQIGGGTIIPDTPPKPKDLNPDGVKDVDLTSFSSKKQKLFRYMFSNIPSRTFNLDWYMDDANINTFEFVYKHRDSTNEQTILKSSGSGDEALWDLRVISNGVSSSFEFRLNNSETGSQAIASNAVSMSTDYSKILDGQLWNVMLQRMTQSSAGNFTNEYRLHAALQDETGIGPYQYVTMSISGGIEQDNNHHANLNWFSSGSRHPLSSSNLVVGQTTTGSLAQIKSWTTALSTSKFRHHVINKFSTVGNTIRSHEQELVYHFKLAENYNSASVSASAQSFKIIDSAPKCVLNTDYSFSRSSIHFASSSVYGFDIINVLTLNLEDNDTKESDNNILIDFQQDYFGDLSSTTDVVNSITNPVGKKPAIILSNKLELINSPQDTINSEILSKLDGFNFEKLYGKPADFYSQSYADLDAFRKEFFECHPIKLDVNKFIRGHESIFNHSLTEALKTVTPAKSTFSDSQAAANVLIKPTILEKQKYKHGDNSVDIVNPFSSSVSIPPSFDFTIENSKDGTYNVNVTNNSSLENTNSGSISVEINENFTFENTKNGTIDVLPQLPSITFDREKSGSFDFTTITNKSFENIHDNYGKGANNTHFINFASDTGSNGDFNTLHLDSRFIFLSIGDEEIYSGSREKYYGTFQHTDFTNHTRLQNRRILTDGLNANFTYESFINGNPGAVTGRMMGKTRYFSASADGTETFFPANHVTKFSQPFKERMNEGTQNTNPGLLNVRYEDYSTASFYRVKVTGGENSIQVRGGSNPSIDNDDRIIY